jgi:4-carboxymuconolactone decarboxylase
VPPADGADVSPEGPVRPHEGRRLATLLPIELTPEQRAVYDSVLASRHRAPPVDPAGSLTGPFNAMLLSPPVGGALERLGAAIRFEGELPDRCRELATLVVAMHARSAYELAMHIAAGRRAGVGESELAAVLCGDDVLADDRERAVVAVARTLVEAGDLTNAEYTAAERVLGPALLFELSTLVGYYQLLALQLRLFRVPLMSGPQ